MDGDGGGHVARRISEYFCRQNGSWPGPRLGHWRWMILCLSESLSYPIRHARLVLSTPMPTGDRVNRRAIDYPIRQS